MSELVVWMNGELVASWLASRGAHKLIYHSSWLESPRRRALSLSLPITADLTVTGDRVKNYFDNLLPDNDAIRERLKRRSGAASAQAFDLLSAIGRDCVGAVQLLPAGTEPTGFDEVNAEPLGEAEVAAILRDVTVDRGMDAGHEGLADFRISIAGAQEKTALMRLGGSWMRPLGATPTTHILKLPIGYVGGRWATEQLESVENEWLCLHLLEQLGLPVAETEIAQFEDQKVLVIERFDRGHAVGLKGPWIARLPQEDFCQATGTAPDIKYERDGGPSIETCMRLLAAGMDPVVDQHTFALTQFSFWMLAATDGHAKNFSLFLHAGDEYGLTPLYDVLSVYPIIGKGSKLIARQEARLAMGLHSKNKHDKLDEIQPRHWLGFAEKSGVPELGASMLEMAREVPAAIERVQHILPPEFPGRLWDSITTGLLAQSRKFLRGI